MQQRYFDVFKKSFVTQGRASRADYWTFGLTNWAILVICIYLTTQPEYLFVLPLIFALITFPAKITLTIRRCHERRASRADYWTFGLTTLVILIICIYLTTQLEYLFVLPLIFAFITFPANITLTIRSCHEGRTSRADYWTFGLTNWATLVICIYLTTRLEYLSVLPLIFTLITLPANITLTIRRCHDFDKSGWFALLCFLPYINFITYIIIGLIPGTKGSNRFG